MISDFEPRLYQQTILNTCINHNTLVVLPTGLGKTAVALLLAAQRLKENPDSKVVFLAPTKPLVQQHHSTFSKHMDVEMDIFTGDIKPEKREVLWNELQIIFSTPQGFENDVISGRLDLSQVSLMIFDEAHRAAGEYAYVFIAQQYYKRNPNARLLALTASPGSSKAKIQEVCDNLFIEEIELRTEEDPDVQPYIQETEIESIIVEMPKDFLQVTKYLRDCYISKLATIRHLGYLSGKPSNYSRKDLLQLQRGMQARIGRGEKTPELWRSLSLLAEAMKVQHALIMAETQGIDSLLSYMQKIMNEAESSKTKAVKNLAKDMNFRSAYAKAQLLSEQGVEHPKILAAKKGIAKTLNNNPDAKIILFNQYRDQIVKLKKELDSLGVKNEVFVGQAKKSGMGLSQKEQKEVIRRFEDGEFNCLLATSVAEEGLDIPAVDLVMFYEPVPSAIRSVQRRGRTGRQEKGRVVVLIAKGTIDEAYRWSAHHKEKRMLKAIRSIKRDFEPEERTLDEYEEKRLLIYADYREKGSGVIKELADSMDVNLKALEVGDFLLSEEVCIEFKKIPDFVDSVVDGRLLDQLKGLRQYRKPLLILQGTEDIYGQRKVHPNAIRGMLSTIMLNYRIPVFQTRDSRDTAEFLKLLAKREQEEGKSQFQFHTSKPLSLKDKQEYVVSALPGIGNTLARPLLLEFGNITKLVNASEDDLKKVDLIGKKKAKDIREVLDEDYKE